MTASKRGVADSPSSHIPGLAASRPRSLGPEGAPPARPMPPALVEELGRLWGQIFVAGLQRLGLIQRQAYGTWALTDRAKLHVSAPPNHDVRAGTVPSPRGPARRGPSRRASRPGPDARRHA
jgi:hypothetical protein